MGLVDNAGAIEWNARRSAMVAAAHNARQAASAVAKLHDDSRRRVLFALAMNLRTSVREVVEANVRDVAAAAATLAAGQSAAGGAAGMSAAKLARLALKREDVLQLAANCEAVANQAPVAGEITRSWTGPTGLEVRKVRTPLGVICMIYEARPGVTIDAFALCFKSGNAVMLKGGREAAQSNAVLGAIVQRTLREAGLPESVLTIVDTSDRELLKVLLQQRESIDLVIPRGGRELIEFVTEHSRIATLRHFRGVCHLYVHESADLGLAQRLAHSGKVSAPATCNATECLVLDAPIARALLTTLLPELTQSGVTCLLCEATIAALGPEVIAQLDGNLVRGAEPGHFGHEFLDLTLAIRSVSGIADAIAHIGKYTSDHTEAIVARDAGAIERFCREVRSSCVLVNASTRNNDGGALGLGAEIGISTSRLHAYGPMGAEDLTVERFVVVGQGQCR